MSFLLSSSRFGESDPYFANVVLLMHMEGAFTDEKGHTFSAQNGATFSSVIKKFGNQSASFDGTNDFIISADSADWDFGTGDFTIDIFCYIAGNSIQNGDGDRTANIINCGPDPLADGWALQLVGNTTTTGVGIRFFNWIGGAQTPAGGTGSVGGTISQTAQHHIAVSRTSGTLKIFLDGVSVYSNAGWNVQINCSSTGLRIGAFNYTSYMEPLNGYIDEVRITKGVGRYTTNFTVPTAQFPDR